MDTLIRPVRGRLNAIKSAAEVEGSSRPTLEWICIPKAVINTVVSMFVSQLRQRSVLCTRASFEYN